MAQHLFRKLSTFMQICRTEKMHAWKRQNQKLQDQKMRDHSCFKKANMHINSLLYFYPNGMTTLLSGVCYGKSVRLSSVCDVRAPYAAGWNFRQYFYVILYHSHKLTSLKHVTEIVQGKPLRPVAAWEFLAPGGIDQFNATFPFFSAPLLLEVGPLEV